MKLLAPASSIKSIQRGIFSSDIAANGSINVNISPVDLSKAKLIVNGGIRYNQGDSIPMAELSSSTNIKIYNNSNGGQYTHQMYWEVIEYV